MKIRSGIQKKTQKTGSKKKKQFDLKKKSDFMNDIKTYLSFNIGLIIK